VSSKKIEDVTDRGPYVARLIGAAEAVYWPVVLPHDMTDFFSLLVFGLPVQGLTTSGAGVRWGEVSVKLVPPPPLFSFFCRSSFLHGVGPAAMAVGADTATRIVRGFRRDPLLLLPVSFFLSVEALLLVSRLIGLWLYHVRESGPG